MQRVLFFTDGSDRYLHEISYIQEKLGDGYDVVVFGVQKNSYQGLRYYQATHIEQILSTIQKDDICIWYWRGFWGHPFGYLGHFLEQKAKKVFAIDDWIHNGIGMDTENLTISISDAPLHKFFKKYLAFYGLRRFLKIIFLHAYTKRKNKVPIVYCGLVEFALAKEHIPNSVQKKQILIVEQPFLKNLDTKKTTAFFASLDVFCAKNSEYDIVFKLHPRSDKEFYEARATVKNIRYEKWDIQGFLDESMYVVWFFSTALYINAFLWKKTIVIDPIGAFRDIQKLELLEYSHTVFMPTPMSVEDLAYESKRADLDRFQFNIESFKKALL